MKRGFGSVVHLALCLVEECSSNSHNIACLDVPPFIDSLRRVSFLKFTSGLFFFHVLLTYIFVCCVLPW